MKMKLYIVLPMLISAFAISTCSDDAGHSNNAADESQSISNEYKQTQKFYQSIIQADKIDVAKLNLFFTRMPKGGDIHHHYTGSIYAETYLDWVKEKGWFIDQCTLKILKPNRKQTAACPALSVDALIKDNARYRELLSLWSDKDFSNHFHAEAAPDTNFFNTFGYFGTVSDDFMRKGLAILKKRAQAENVSYIESMLSRVGLESSSYFPDDKTSRWIEQLRQAKNQQAVNAILGDIAGELEANPRFSAQVNGFVQRVNAVHAGIDDANFSMRFQTYGVRVLNPVQVFMDLFSGYLAAQKSALIVGVNIVAPENNHVSLADYTLHMRMFNYLLNRYPNVHRALHAGELTLGMVRPKNLIFHINQARSIAQAERIGHGVDIPYEAHSLALLKDLKANAAIEINLTSNQFILGVEKNTHPYQIYAAYGVPLVISTDDSGVSRNNLSSEYMLLASRYKPNYARIKAYVYNSIKYSFLNAKDKQKQRAILDKEFTEFEKDMAKWAAEMK